MTDIHCHILPHMDDGPARMENSIELIRMQMRDGITKAVATPHFNPERQSLESFVRARRNAVENVTAELARTGLVFSIVPGAEVLLHPSLLGLENAPLCFGAKSLMLVELNQENRWPLWADDVLYQLRLKGTVPILAHIDRYGFLLKHPEKLVSLSESGVLLQVNATSLLEPSLRPILLKLFRHRLISFIASDCHSVNHRPPKLTPAFSSVEKKLGQEAVSFCKESADDAFAGKIPDQPDAVPIAKPFFQRFFS